MRPFDIHRILVPTDFSECGQSALAPARQLAAMTGAEIVLLNVMDHGVYYDTAYCFIDPAALINEAGRERLENLERIARENFPGARARWIVAQGLPEEAIVEQARNERTDIIVMSTHGHTGLRHWLMGSVAEHVVRNAPCPVLTVKPAYAAAETVPLRPELAHTG